MIYYFRGSEIPASNYDVKLYDYSSCFPSQYGKTPGIVEKVQAAGEVMYILKLCIDKALSKFMVLLNHIVELTSTFFLTICSR